MAWQDVFRPKPLSRSGYNITTVPTGRIGTGGLTIANTATTSTLIPIGRIRVSVLSLALEFLTPATSTVAVTAQAFRVNAAGTKVALSGAVSLKSDIITGGVNFSLPITATLFDSVGNVTRVVDGTIGDYLQVDLVAAGTVSAQPQGHITAELAVLQ